MECYSNNESKCIVGYEGITFIPDITKEDRIVRLTSVETTGVVDYIMHKDSILFIYVDRIHWVTSDGDIVIKVPTVGQVCINTDHTILYVNNEQHHFMYTMRDKDNPTDYFVDIGYYITSMSNNSVSLRNTDGSSVMLNRERDHYDHYLSGCGGYYDIFNRLNIKEIAMTPIKEGFETFAKEVISKDAPDIQHDEMRLAFYAGATCYMNEMVKISDMEEHPAIAHLRALRSEVLQLINEFGDNDNNDDTVS